MILLVGESGLVGVICGRMGVLYPKYSILHLACDNCRRNESKYPEVNRGPSPVLIIASDNSWNNGILVVPCFPRYAQRDHQAGADLAMITTPPVSANTGLVRDAYTTCIQLSNRLQLLTAKDTTLLIITLQPHFPSSKRLIHNNQRSQVSRQPVQPEPHPPPTSHFVHFVRQFLLLISILVYRCRAVIHDMIG